MPHRTLQLWLAVLNAQRTRLEHKSRFHHRADIRWDHYLWQFIHQNRIGLACLVGMMLIGSLCAIVVREVPFSAYKSIAEVGVTLGALAVTWLGVFAFSGDATPANLRFLADRGVSPTRVWIGRQWLCVSILAIMASLISLGGNGSLATITLLLGCAYSVSQWTSQASQTIAVSALLAPVLSAATIYWLIYCVFTYGTPLWLIVLLIVLPMLASCLSMHRYMEGRRDVVRYMIAGGTSC